MKILFSSLAFFLLALTAPLRAESVYAQLCRVNPEWKKITPDADMLRDTVFADENALLRTHVFMVERHLRNTSIERSAALTKERGILLDVLHRYGVASNFPKNTHHPDERRAYFIDDYGTHCPVACLLTFTGNDALARRISSEANFALLRDIKTEGLSEWQKASGLTVDELALIQELNAYEPVQPMLLVTEDDSTLVKPVVGQARYSGGQLKYSGTGVDGTLNGRWVQYYANGKQHVVGSYNMGKKQGAWTVYGRNGKVISRTYADAKQTERSVAFVNTRSSQ